MTNRELKLKLKGLRQVKAAVSPNALWLAETRRSLVAGAKLAAPGVQMSAPIVLPLSGWQRAFRVMSPIVASFMAIGLGIAGWAAGIVSISSNAGSLAKNAAERTQLTFAADASSRAYLHLDLAGRRANELAALAETEGNDQSQVIAAMASLREEIASVGSSLDEVKSAKSADTAAVAKAVDRKVAEIQTVMNKTKRLLDAGAKAQAAGVAAAADDVSIKAVAVLAADAQSQADKTDAANRVQDKIADLESNLQVASTEGSAEAKAALAALSAAKKALEQDNLSEAVTKVQEGADIVNNVTVQVNVVEPNANSNVNVPKPASATDGKTKAVGM